MKILVIGGSGYIGSLVTKELSTNHVVHVVDTQWHTSSPSNIPCHQTEFQQLPASFIQTFDAVLLFAGHSSVAMSRGVISSALYNNVTGPIDLVKKLRPEQLFIYSSSSSVYGDAPHTMATEIDTPSAAYTEYDFTKRTFDDYMKMQTDHTNWWGLRYATVCGGAPVIRTDLMINMMYHTAQLHNKVYIFGGKVRRSLLSINKLVAGIVSILNHPHAAGIYNLSSLGSTNIDIATSVAHTLNVPIEYQSPTGISKTTSSRYNYIISSEKFETTFQCSLTATVEDIVSSIREYYPVAQLTTRELPYVCRSTT